MIFKPKKFVYLNEKVMNLFLFSFILEHWKLQSLDDLKAPTAYIKDVPFDGKRAAELYYQRTKTNMVSKKGLKRERSGRVEDVESKMIYNEPYASLYKQRRDGICGHKWQGSYKKLHKDILESRQPRKFIVFTCKVKGYGCAGYGNRLDGIASLLLLSILTKRAFLIEWNDHEELPLEFYLTPKNIAWNYSVKNLAETLGTRRHFWGLKRVKSRTNRTDVLRIADTKAEFTAWFQKTNFQTYFDHPIEKVVGMWYFAEELWKNKFFKESALELGISSGRFKYSLVGCAFDFLFQKSPELQARLDATKKALGLTRQAPKIGLHVRMGDISMGKSLQYNDINYKDFFDCAHALSKALAQQNPGVFKENDIIWFLATDDAEVKKYALQKYAANVVTQMITPKHILGLYKLKHSESVEEMFNIIVDHFLLSECDFLVLSNTSTFGRTAAGIMFHSEATIMEIYAAKIFVS